MSWMIWDVRDIRRWSSGSRSYAGTLAPCSTYVFVFGAGFDGLLRMLVDVWISNIHVPCSNGRPRIVREGLGGCDAALSYSRCMQTHSFVRRCAPRGWRGREKAIACCGCVLY